jgi:hypothetical protein
MRLKIAGSLLLASLVFTTAPAFAGGPLANCSSGVPFKWVGGGVNIPFNPDQGTLGPLDNAGAVAQVSAAFGAWQAVPSSVASYVNAGPLPVDVDITNFEPYLNPTAPDGLSAIVFDANGEIFDLLFGPGSGILGFAGPEWGDTSTCTITEGVSFLNGPSFGDATEALDVMVHEFGHYTNLAHTSVNGQAFFFDDANAPGGTGSGQPFEGPVAFDQIETMYPFYGGAGQGTSSPHRDDIAALSTLYPEPSFLTTTASISGTIFAPNGTTRLSGVNVVARNVANPFDDAVSGLSGNRTDDVSQADPLSGTYLFRGLTPGAQYAVFVDQILAGGFSTAPILLPGAEEFYNTGESNNATSPDDPTVFTAVSAAAGATASGINVIFNTFAPGDALPVGDDGFVELFPKFPFKLCGQEFSSVFVNANGNLTFGASSGGFSESVSGLLGGMGGTSALLAPPRIAGLWDDLNPAAGGTVSFDETPSSFTVTWDGVPEFPAAGSNTFSITLKRGSQEAILDYGDLSATDGLAGVACGSSVTSGFENERDLIRWGHRNTIDMEGETAAFEIFTAADNDLAHRKLTFVNFRRAFKEAAEAHGGNNDLAHAQRIQLPFTNASTERYAEISPVGGDVDYYRFQAKGGDILAIEVVRGAPDTLLGLFDADTGDLLALDDDNGCCGIGGLSRLLLQVPDSIHHINLAVAVTSWPDFDFNGTEGVTGGRYVLSVNKYRGEILDTGDDTSTEVALARPFRFQGTNWNSVWVNSNGNLTFGAGDADFGESVGEFLAGPPRIAPLWDDLDASPGQGLVIAERGFDQTTIHFVSVPQFFDLAGNYFSVQLGPFGKVEMEYGPTARGDALVGITGGGGVADPGETDLSEGCRSIFSARRTTYELFNTPVSAPEPFDLSFEKLLFVSLF